MQSRGGMGIYTYTDGMFKNLHCECMCFPAFDKVSGKALYNNTRGTWT